jgi:hypothetical protein
MENRDTVGPAVTEPGSSGLAFAGLWQVIISPITFFEKLKNDPKVLAPYLVLAILMGLYLFSIGDLMAQAQMDAARQQGQMVPEAMERIARWTGPAFGLFFICLMPVVIAGLAMFFGNFVMGGSASWGQVLSVCLYASMIFVLHAMLTWPIVEAKQSMLVSLSPAAFLSEPDAQSVLFQTLHRLGPFYLWEWIVTGLGFSAIFGFSRNKGMLLAVLSTVLLSALAIGATYLGSLFR